MRFSLALTAATLVGFTMPVWAGQEPAGAGAIATATPAVDVARLPVNVTRIGRQLRQVQTTEVRDGLKIRYTLNVYGELPKIQFVTPLDNLLRGDVPGTAPTHADMIRMMTPQEFSAPVIGVSIPRRR
jgi:hypothetical protein